MDSPSLAQRGSGELCPAWAWPILRTKACHRCIARSSQCWLYPTRGNPVEKSLEGQLAGREESGWQLCAIVMSRLWILELPQVALISSQLGYFRYWPKVRECACDRSMCTTTVLALLHLIILQDFKTCRIMGPDYWNIEMQILLSLRCGGFGVCTQANSCKCVISTASGRL